MTMKWLAESDRAPNWYAGTLARYPITSLISQARQTESHEKCQAWCDKTGGFHPKPVEVQDAEQSDA